MKKSTIVAIDGSAGNGKSTLLSGLHGVYGENCVIIPEGNQFIPFLGDRMANPGMLEKINAVRAAESYRWHLVQEARKQGVPYIFLDTTLRHSLIANVASIICKDRGTNLPSRQRHRTTPDSDKTSGLKMINPDYTIILYCPSKETLRQRLIQRGSLDHADHIPTSLYQNIYKVGYKFLGAVCMQKNIGHINTSSLNTEQVLENACEIILKATNPNSSYNIPTEPQMAYANISSAMKLKA